MTQSSARSALVGAAFLMATSAIGPGFITQTTVFTERLFTSFGFIILCSILLDIAAQLNIWRVIAVSKLRAQDIANRLVPGAGYFLALLILLGGLAFNIGNIAGAGLGLNVILGINVSTGAIISCIISILIFWVKNAGVAVDLFAKILGFVMIGLTMYVAVSSHPPVPEAVYRTFIPEKFDTTAIVTLVGGTVGGYISFAGGHRLLDAGVTGRSQLPQVTKSSITAILIASTMRVLLFLAALGIVATGAKLDAANPAASVFQIAAGDIGYKIFGVVLWSAAITSVIGSAYTSVSFIKSFHPLLQKHERLIITGFILFSTIIFLAVGRPVTILIFVGALNGLILPLALALILLAASKQRIVGDYQHPVWMSVAGWLVVAAMTWMGVKTVMPD